MIWLLVAILVASLFARCGAIVGLLVLAFFPLLIVLGFFGLTVLAGTIVALGG